MILVVFFGFWFDYLPTRGCIMMSMVWGVWMERNSKENKNSRGKQHVLPLWISSSLIAKGYDINSIC